ncbi:SNARE-associated protein Snapin-like [Ruditapes philippinarum]|uniref:SNARE-associated protein Snapin-like n=1 Tax=Ruditapes philippinarum TaxID=129788 RepID=UPI00295B3201|nr:SNARE-associated protein Snapin-like [Ruditapes philippinarum]
MMADSDGPFPNSSENANQYDRRDAISDGIIDLLKPTVEEIDDRVKTVRESQVELRQQIDSLAGDLQVISSSQTISVDLESYVKKLNNSRRRVMRD